MTRDRSTDRKETRNESHMQNYSGFWQKDLKLEGDADVDTRLDNYNEVSSGFNDGATDLYEFGWSQSFHFARFNKGEGFCQALARHEHYLVHQMNLKAGMKVLDVGCGVGGPAREIAAFANVNIVGVNNNLYQVHRARKYAAKQGLQNKLQFVQGDFMTLSQQFEPNSFDAVYAIEATAYAPSWEGVYSEIKKVLKPGGIFGVYEWGMTDAWDPSNPEHKDIAHRIEYGNGVVEVRTTKQCLEAVKNVGFELLHHEDLADCGDAIPWYYPLEGDLTKSQTLWDVVTSLRLSWAGKRILENVIWVSERLGFSPKGTLEVGKALDLGTESFVAAGKRKLFTPMFLVIARKPEI